MKSRRSQKAHHVKCPKDVPKKQDALVVNDLLLPPAYALEGPKTDRYICYSRRYFLRGAPVDLMTDKASPEEALLWTRNGVSDASVFDQALLSFSTVIFGSEHHQKTIVEQGYICHETALKSVNRALCRHDCAAHDEILLAIVILAMLESLRPTASGSYVYHMIGLDELLKLRDPLQHTSTMSLHIYKSIRHFILFSSLRTGRPSVFARPEWKFILRMSCTPEELIEQEVWDVLADCSVLQARYIAMCSEHCSEISCEEEMPNMKVQASALYQSLYSWRISFDADPLNAYYVIPVSDVKAGPLHLQSAFQFPRDVTAKTLTLYSTTLVHVLQILKTLDDHGKAHAVNGWSPTSFGPTISPSYKDLDSMLIDAACEVCRCIPHFMGLRPDAILGCTPIIHWGVSTAWNVLRSSDAPEAVWLGYLVRSEMGRFLAKGLFADD